jgi:hypothetical protein
MASRRLNWRASNRFGGAPWRWPADQSVTARIVLAAVALCTVSVLYMNARPQPDWMLWLGAGLAVLAADGIVRLNPRWYDASLFSALAYAILPALTFLGAGLALDSIAEGYFRLLAGLGIGLLTTIAIVGEYQTVSVGEGRYGSSRLLLAALAYAVAFGLIFAINDSGIGYGWRAALTALVSFVLAAEILRESHIESLSNPLSALAIAVSLAELQLALYFFPLDEMSRAALLAVGFYVSTGSLHHLLENNLDLYTGIEYMLVAAGGILAVLLAQQAL